MKPRSSSNFIWLHDSCQVKVQFLQIMIIKLGKIKNTKYWAVKRQNVFKMNVGEKAYIKIDV